MRRGFESFAILMDLFHLIHLFVDLFFFFIKCMRFYLLDNIHIRFGTKLYRQIVGIAMDTNCAPLAADLFLYCYERDFMESLNYDNQADVIEAFNSTSRYLDDLLDIDNPYFERMVNQICPPELQMNKVNITDTEVPFLGLHLSIANGLSVS